MQKISNRFWNLSIVLGGLSLLANSASATCLAIRVESISYGSKMKYIVSCEKEFFETKSIPTMILLPLPYNWGKVAKDRLFTLMANQGYAPAKVIRAPDVSLREFNYDLADFIVFEKNGAPSNNYRLALFAQERETGIDAGKKLRYASVNILTDDAVQNRKFYADVTSAEITEHLAKDGFKPALTSAPLLGKVDGYNSFGNSLRSGFMKFTLFKSK